MPAALAAAGPAAIVGGVVCAAALFVGALRSPGFVTAAWPANALLLALLVRRPAWSSAAGWSAAACGYLAGEFLTGGEPAAALWRTAANIAGTGTGVMLFERLSEDDRRLRRPEAVRSLFVICLLASLASALVGGTVGLEFPHNSWLTGCLYWFMSQLVTSVLLVPVILTAPRRTEVPELLRRLSNRVRRNPRVCGPAAALAASTALSICVGGPATLAVPVPALLWCALSYSLFATTSLTLLACAAMKFSMSAGLLTIHPMSDFIVETISIRLGAALMAFGPLAAGAIHLARERVVQSLERLVNRDALTDVLARRAFLEQGAELVSRKRWRRLQPAVLMLDLDHFKQINDRHGHAVGDRVLVAFAGTMAGVLRNDDLIGRMGGEEFAAVLPQVNPRHAWRVAEEIRTRVAASEIRLENGETVKATVSIGVAFPDSGTTPTLDALLSAADAALYESKRAGRNRVSRPAPPEPAEAHTMTATNPLPARARPFLG